jgi:hypothetical protein
MGEPVVHAPLAGAAVRRGQESRFVRDSGSGDGGAAQNPSAIPNTVTRITSPAKTAFDQQRLAAASKGDQVILQVGVDT